MDESHAAGAPTRASSSPSVIVVLDAAAGVLALAELSAAEALLGEKRPAPDVRENGDAPAPPPVEKRLTEAANALPSVGSVGGCDGGWARSISIAVTSAEAAASTDAAADGPLPRASSSDERIASTCRAMRCCDIAVTTAVAKPGQGGVALPVISMWPSDTMYRVTSQVVHFLSELR